MRNYVLAMSLCALAFLASASSSNAQSFDAAPFGPLVGRATYVSTVVGCPYNLPCSTTATITQHQILDPSDGNGGETDRAYFCGTYDLVVAYCNPASWLGSCSKVTEISPTRIVAGIAITVTVTHCANFRAGNCKAVSGQIAHDQSLLLEISSDAWGCSY